MAAPTYLSTVNIALPVSATPGAQNLTVPSDATGVLVFWSQWGPRSSLTLSSLSSNFSDAFTILQLEASQTGSGKDGVGVAFARVTSTGAKTITPVWNFALDAGPTFMVVFVKDIPASPAAWVRDTDVKQDTSGSAAQTGTVDSATDDIVFAFDSNDGTGVPSNPTGWTSRSTQTNSPGSFDISSRLRTANSPGASTTSATTTGTGGFATMAMASVIGATGGATNYSLTCDTGAYTLTGESATTSRGVRMTGDVGSYALTGQAATTSRGYSLAGDVGAYSLTGEAAATQAAFRIGADTGAYSLTGQDATLTYSQGTTNYTLTAETGNYTLTGVDAGTTAGRRLVADVGAYSLTGQSATTSKGTRLVADVGAYTLTGQDATLTATATVNYTLICETGDYSLSGVDAQLTYGTGANPFFPPYGLFWLPALEEEDLPEPVVEVLREVVPRVIDEPKKESIAELKQALRAENIPFRKAYQDALLRVVEQARQAEEDEEEEAVAVALMSLL